MSETNGYELHIFGGEGIENTKDYFTYLDEAVAEAEGRSSSDTRGWELHDGEIRLVDDNHGHGVVIAEIYPVEAP